jgi:hypothetical protein
MALSVMALLEFIVFLYSKDVELKLRRSGIER